MNGALPASHMAARPFPLLRNIPQVTLVQLLVGVQQNQDRELTQDKNNALPQNGWEEDDKEEKHHL